MSVGMLYALHTHSLLIDNLLILDFNVPYNHRTFIIEAQKRAPYREFLVRCLQRTLREPRAHHKVTQSAIGALDLGANGRAPRSARSLRCGAHTHAKRSAAQRAPGFHLMMRTNAQIVYSTLYVLRFVQRWAGACARTQERHAQVASKRNFLIYKFPRNRWWLRSR